MAASRKKAPTIGSSQWTLDERQQSNDLIMQELEDFSFSVRNELEWLNEHMNEIFAQNGQNNLDVFKTPGKLRGKTPRTARKKAAEPRQPLGDIFSTNVQRKPSPAQQSLSKALQKNAPIAKFQIAEDTENIDPAISTPVKSPVPRPLFSKQLGKGKENRDSPLHATTREEDTQISRFGQTASTIPVQWSPKHSTQDTVPDTQEDTQIFSQPQTQSTQPTQSTQSFGLSLNTSDNERRDTGESFVSAKEALGSNRVSKENLDDHFNADAMDVDSEKPENASSDAQATAIHIEVSPSHENTTAIHHELSSPQQPRVVSEVHGIPADAQEARGIPDHRAHDMESKSLTGMAASTNSSDPALHHDDTVVHHDIEDDMDIDDDVRSPSDNSSPVKPVRKSSLSFAPLPSREPLLAKKSMGNRVSRTSHVDQSKARNSQLGRYTSGKSLGGSQYTQMAATHDDVMDLDHDRPGVQREESETTRLHNSTSTKSLKERLDMLNHRNEPPKRISQNVVASQPSQPHTSSFSQSQLPHSSQPAYPSLPSGEQEKENEDEDDDWISPVRTVAPAPNVARPILSKSYSADTRPVTSSEAIVAKPISVSNPHLSTVVESTTPVGSPTGKKYVDGPISASKAKLYSAFRVAKEKIIGSSATSAQAKLDALAEGPMRPQLQATSSSEDIFSPKRNEKNGNSFFSHLRSPSKESVKSTKTATKVAAMPGSPVKDDGRRTRSSSERERQKEKEAKQKNRTEERLKEMRSKEQLKAAAHYQKTKAAATKTPVAPPSQPNFRAAAAATKTPVNTEGPQRPGTIRMNTGPRQQDPDCGDDMPPPPPPKSLLPTGPGHKLREPKDPKRLAKAPSKDTLPKGKPQKIQVNLHRDRFGQAPAASKLAPPPTRMGPPPVPKPAPQAPRTAPIANNRPAAPKVVPAASKPAPRVGRPGQPIKMQPKPAPASTQPRSDLAAARSVSRLQTVEDANRIKVYPVNPAKSPPKRPFQPESDEPAYRPVKRPSPQARSKPVTPHNAQFAQGKIPFAEPYPPSEDIKLPDIMTDSEDEDSDNDFEQPSWVNTPNLREMLTNQQLVDPEQIFGPIAPLNMEQVFPNKERHKRFRDRTSSAYWANDQVTEEERRKEREARERLVRDGAWTYNPSPAPERRA